MISVSEATSIIFSHLLQPKKEKVDIRAASGRVLAESVKADRDFPPFDRVTMDGVALASSEFEYGLRKFRITGIQAAGQPASELSGSGTCIEVMTGALLPKKADTVVPYEDIQISEGAASIILTKLSAGDNIHFRSTDAKRNEVLLTPGIRISAAEVALLATVGMEEVEVISFPTTAIVTTGDELVDISKTPLPHQIRRSNGYALQSALHQLGGESVQYHLPDEKETLEKNLASILENHSLIILSGGVSKGKFDFIPPVLESLGVHKLFHQVSQKPGKPFWFGKSDRHTVFALPGNPVSTYLCFYRYIQPWLLKSFGTDFSFPSAVLAADFSFAPALTYFLQVKVQNKEGVLMAYPAPGHGSGDFANLKGVDGFLELPASLSEFKAGEIFPFIPFR